MTKRRGGASGRTRPDADRRAEGARKISVWLDQADAERLAQLEAQAPGPGATARALRAALRLAWERVHVA